MSLAVQNFRLRNNDTTVANYPQTNLRNNGPQTNSVNNSSPNLAPLDKDIVNFRGETTESNATVVQEENKKKGLSKGAKWAIGIGGGLATLVTAISLVAIHKGNKLSQLYKDKMQFQELAEHIDFKPAETLDDAIKFAKETLKIGEVDKNFTLDALNFANQGIVEVSNANKGKLFIPKKMTFVDMGDGVLAAVRRDIKSNEFGRLAINKKWFDDDFITKNLKSLFGLDKKTVAKAEKTIIEVEKEVKEEGLNWLADCDERLDNLYNKLIKDPQQLSVVEKRDLFFSILNGMLNRDQILNYQPLKMLDKYTTELNRFGIKFNTDDLKRLPLEEQKIQVESLLLELQKANGEGGISYFYDKLSVTSDIHHELGHLQDYAKNLKELALDKWKKLNSFHVIKEAFKDAKTGKTNFDSEHMDKINNRWGGKTYKGYKELLDKNPEKFKKLYPDMYEHLTNKEIQNTAGKVSWYAQTSIGEFVAEVYAKLVSGAKLDDDVMKLYKKYNGPMLCEKSVA